MSSVSPRVIPLMTDNSLTARLTSPFTVGAVWAMPVCVLSQKTSINYLYQRNSKLRGGLTNRQNVLYIYHRRCNGCMARSPLTIISCTLPTDWSVKARSSVILTVSLRTTVNQWLSATKHFISHTHIYTSCYSKQRQSTAKTNVNVVNQTHNM